MYSDQTLWRHSLSSKPWALWQDKAGDFLGLFLLPFFLLLPPLHPLCSPSWSRITIWVISLQEGNPGLARLLRAPCALWAGSQPPQIAFWQMLAVEGVNQVSLWLGVGGSFCRRKYLQLEVIPAPLGKSCQGNSLLWHRASQQRRDCPGWFVDSEKMDKVSDTSAPD